MTPHPGDGSLPVSERDISVRLSGYELALIVWAIKYRIDTMIVEEEDDRIEEVALVKIRDRLQNRLAKRESRDLSATEGMAASD